MIFKVTLALAASLVTAVKPSQLPTGDYLLNLFQVSSLSLKLMIFIVTLALAASLVTAVKPYQLLTEDYLLKLAETADKLYATRLPKSD